MDGKRISSRVQGQRKVLDEEGRKRRMTRQLEMLSLDNHHEEPEIFDLQYKGPIFDDNWRKVNRGRKQRNPKKRLAPEVFKRPKTFETLLDEESDNFKPNVLNYVTAVVPPSKYPEKHFCSICGFPSNYTCPVCGDRYCSVKCYKTHKDTRCLKFVS